MKKFTQATKAIAVLSLVSLGGAFVPAHSAAIANSLITPGVINEFEDRDVERFLDANGASIATGEIQLGYTIESILRFTGFAPSLYSPTIFGNTNTISDVIPAPYQLTAYAQLSIVAIFNEGGTPTLSMDTCTNIVTGFGRECTLLFAPTGNLGENVFAQLYERSTANAANNFDEALAPDSAIAAVQAQTLIATLGLGDTDDFWVATTLLNLDFAASQAQGTSQVANGIFGLSLLSNPGALPIGTNSIQSFATGTLHDVVGNASAYQRSSGTNNGWLVSSNTTIDFFVPRTVPEPGSLALVGLALAGLGLAKRRQ